MKARRVKKLDPRRPLGENAARIVSVRLDEMRSFAPKALKPGRLRQQHDMRIAAKRLRYVLEATEFCFGRPGQVARRRARDLQDILGELHDCDVMLPRAERHLALLRDADATAVRKRAGLAADLDPGLAARAPHRTSYRGLEILMVYLQARRELLFERFQAFWTEQERAGTWDRLDRAAERLVGEARERRRSARRAEKAQQVLESAEQRGREAARAAAAAAAELDQARASSRDERPTGPLARPGHPLQTAGEETAQAPDR